MLRSVEKETTVRRAEALSRAKEAHKSAFYEEYLAYLEQTEKTLQAACPALYEAFLAKREGTS